MGSLDRANMQLIAKLDELNSTLEKSIKSQDRLAITQIILAIIGVAIAALQLIQMFVTV